MIAARFHGVITINRVDAGSVSYGGHQNCRMRLISNGFRNDKPLLRKDYCRRSMKFEMCVTCASNSFSSSINPVLSSSQGEVGNSTSKENESVLILIRHGESMWNEKNLFTGCVDVPLTEKGVEEAIEAGKRISNVPIDIVYTSALVRSQMTAMLALTEHRCMKKWPLNF